MDFCELWNNYFENKIYSKEYSNILNEIEVFLDKCYLNFIVVEDNDIIFAVDLDLINGDNIPKWVHVKNNKILGFDFSKKTDEVYVEKDIVKLINDLYSEDNILKKKINTYFKKR